MQSHQDVVVSIAPPHGTSYPNEMNFTIDNSDTEMMMTQLLNSKKSYSQPVLSDQYKDERDACTKQFDSWSEQEQVNLTLHVSTLTANDFKCIIVFTNRCRRYLRINRIILSIFGSPI